MIDGGVIAEHREVGRVAAGSHAFGNSACHAEYSVTGYKINGRMSRCFKGSQAAQFGNGIVGHAVAEDNYTFHMGLLFCQPVLNKAGHIIFADNSGEGDLCISKVSKG